MIVWTGGMDVKLFKCNVWTGCDCMDCRIECDVEYM